MKSYIEPRLKDATIYFRYPLFDKSCEFKEDDDIKNIEGGKHHTDKHHTDKYHTDKHHTDKHHTDKHHTDKQSKFHKLIFKKRQSLYSLLNKISDYAPVLYRYLIKNAKHIELNNIKNILSSYLEEVDIDYHKAIKKNITVDKDWIQLYNSLL
jgi:hypothetical protein